MSAEGGLRRRVRGLSEAAFRARFGTEAPCRTTLYELALGGHAATAPVATDQPRGG